MRLLNALPNNQYSRLSKFFRRRNIDRDRPDLLKQREPDVDHNQYQHNVQRIHSGGFVERRNVDNDVCRMQLRGCSRWRSGDLLRWGTFPSASPLPGRTRRLWLQQGFRRRPLRFPWNFPRRSALIHLIKRHKH